MLPRGPGSASWYLSAPGTSLCTWYDRFRMMHTQFSTDCGRRELVGYGRVGMGDAKPLRGPRV